MVNVDPDTRLDDCLRIGLGTDVPFPLNQRVDELVRVANEAGAGTNRRELVSALLLHAPEDAETLSKRIVDYRRACASDAALQTGQLADVLEFRRHPRGPRRRIARA